MVAGAESQPGLDFDTDAVGLYAGAVMRTMDHKSARLDWLQAVEAFPHPVGRRQRFERERICDFGTGS